MIITLIGYRGTGKSSIAPALAARLGWTWVDADVELEHRAGRSIREIFTTDGEPEFRRLERATLVSLLAQERLVIAAGGGAILNPDTRADFRQAGPVVWLTADVPTIAERLTSDPTTAARRPSLTGQSLIDEIAGVLKQREPLYRETATIIMPTQARSVAEIVQEIVSQLPADIMRPGTHSSGDPT